MDKPLIWRTTCARIPTDTGVFQLCHFANTVDNKEHLAIVMGDVTGGDVLVRVHSECFTGDVLGSRRCDCGEQLARALEMVAAEGRGVVIYLRQEGRGIGLENKLRAYNLQDSGYDTVDANLMLGHQADEREYWAAAGILRDLGVDSIRLLTNNPTKLEKLHELGVAVNCRIPLEPTVNADNAGYLETKAQRMRHILSIADTIPAAPNAAYTTHLDALRRRAAHHFEEHGRPFVTVSYAQSIDGSIAARPGQQLLLSGPTAMTMTHRLRGVHDAIVVGIGTVLADDPQLTVRLAPGDHPRPVVLDSDLRMPAGARLLNHPAGVVIATNGQDSSRVGELSTLGATLLRLPTTKPGHLDLAALLTSLGELGIRSVMVEGGAEVLTSFLAQRLADYVVVTIAPRYVGGVAAVGPHAGRLPRLTETEVSRMDEDLMLWGVPVWDTDA